MRRAALSLRPSPPPPAIGSVRLFAPQQTIFAEGEPAAHFILVIHGLVRSCSLFPDGRRFIGAFHAAGDLFGLECGAAYLTSAEAVCETAVAFYPAPDWFREAGGQNIMSHPIVGAMLRGSNQARAHARLLARLRAIEKISAFLLECHGRSTHGTLIELEMTRQDIADYLGLTVETVSRCLAKLNREGLISISTSRHLDILDVAKLKKMTE